MPLDTDFLLQLFLVLLIAFAISFASTPLVKAFAEKFGAMDVPKEKRRVHDHPIPRLGGMAIFFGFILSVILFADITKQVQGILIGAVLIVITGAVDDFVSLKPGIKFSLQIIAAVIAVAHGVVVQRLMNPFAAQDSFSLGILSIPITIIWIVGVTNSVNLIDGLDGLAVGISTISSITMLIIALLVADGNVALILAALAGACIGFIPYNFNPAKIFMGDTGALLLGYVLSTVSIIGLFKFYAVVSFLVPILALALPISDTIFAFTRRILKGQNPMKADRGHFHHRLIDLGFNQKQAVAILYFISAILGLTAVVLTTSGPLKALILFAAFLIALTICRHAVHTKYHEISARSNNKQKSDHPDEKESSDENN
ncbi:MAG: MraY family glycosyltransferase [Oscillospiraceae bacterium]|jgi:UDP-GlcNAc:undecaprenyl-phosphate GlcNAc-1-phosphate transferase